MTPERLIVLLVVLAALGADTATAMVLWRRRGGRVWALLCGREFGMWLLTISWLLLVLTSSSRYDTIPWPMWGALVGRVIQSLFAWRLAYRVLAGDRT